jgi:hypothetical protein
MKQCTSYEFYDVISAGDSFPLHVTSVSDFQYTGQNIWQLYSADCWPPASAEVEKMWIYTSTSPYAFMAYCISN